MEFNESDFNFDDLDDDGNDDDFYAGTSSREASAFGQVYDNDGYDDPYTDDAYGDVPEPTPMARARSGRKSPLSGLELGSLLQNPRNAMIAIAAGFLVGMLVGWIVLGWYVAPVTWVDANAADLRQDLQVDFMRMAIDSYNLRPDTDAATRRLQEFGSVDHAGDILAEVAAAPNEQSGEVIRVFEQLVTTLGGSIGSGGQDAVNPDVEAFLEEGESAGPGGWFYGIICALLVAGVGLVGMFFLRRNRDNGPRTAAAISRQYSERAESTDFEALGESAPISQWMTTYLISDDLFDDSFSIDSPMGEFLGECGVGIADTIGVGEPKRVSAFEIWLFDKNDIQTVTKVLMSNNVYQDSMGRERLSAKGEPILARPGEQAILETETLQMVARVIDMAYGVGPLPDESFFDRVTIELAVWQK